jgi:hypothetical protein
MFAAGVPLKIPVAGSKLTPAGNVPLRLNVGVGAPVVVTVNAPPVPTMNTVLGSLVIAGASKVADTVSTKFCSSSPPTPLLAVQTSA